MVDPLEEHLKDMLDMPTDGIRAKPRFSRNALRDEITYQRPLIDMLYDVVELITYEKWADAIEEWRLLHRQGYALSEKQMDYAEGIKSALIEKGII